MKARPILFSASMVRALLDGRKTQTRRTVKPQPDGPLVGRLERPIRSMQHDPVLRAWFGAGEKDRSSVEVTCPYGKPGDLLWVRETWAPSVEPENHRFARVGYTFRADWSAEDDVHQRDFRWKPSLYMPRWASRLTLEITGVRVERLQNISEADARAEGCPVTWDGKPYDPPPPEVDSWQGYGRYSYCLLWNRLNGPGAWYANPWVWVLEFAVHLCNVDELLKREVS